MEDDYEGSNRTHLNAREQACIMLRIPESGTPWLDRLILRSIVREEATVVDDNSQQLPLL